MHDLGYIKAINANPAAFHAANAAADAENARTKPTRDAALKAQQLHGDRVAARQKANGPFVTTQEPRHLGQEGIECAIDQRETPFLKFWRLLNAKGQAKTYGEARRAYIGLPMPANALTFAGPGHDAIRAARAPNVNGERAYYGEFATKGVNGETIWLRVTNGGGDDISYTTAEYALAAALLERVQR